MNVITLITTKGCEACFIMRNSIEQAVSIASKDIYFKEIDAQKLFKENKELYNKLNLKDFPTTIFKTNDIITRKVVGSKPYAVVLRWIDLDFK